MSPFGVNQIVPVGTLDGQLLDFGPLGYCPGPIDPSDPRGDGELYALPGTEAAAGKSSEPIKPREPVEPQPIDEQGRGKFIATWTMI